MQTDTFLAFSVNCHSSHFQGLFMVVSSLSFLQSAGSCYEGLSDS